MKDAPVSCEKKGDIAWLSLDRPQRRNAMGFSLFKQLIELFNDLDQDPQVRVVVIRATGDTFTAGLDLSEAGALLENRGARGREVLFRQIREMQHSMTVVEACRKPVIAAVHGHCIGAGVDLLCACDIRLASRDAVFSIRETRMAIVADLGTLQRLPHIIGQGRFRELALTGRDFTAEEALAMGFVTHMAEDREQLWTQAGSLARTIADNPPLTVQGVKEVINYSRDHGVHPGLAYVAQKNAATLISDDLIEAFSAFMEKRTPQFKGK